MIWLVWWVMYIVWEWYFIIWLWVFCFLRMGMCGWFWSGLGWGIFFDFGRCGLILISDWRWFVLRWWWESWVSVMRVLLFWVGSWNGGWWMSLFKFFLIGLLRRCDGFCVGIEFGLVWLVLFFCLLLWF